MAEQTPERNRMLHLHIRNVCTGPDDAANYQWELYVNSERREVGHVTGHDRSKGWRELLRMIAGESPDLDRLRAENAALRTENERFRADEAARKAIRHGLCPHCFCEWAKSPLADGTPNEDRTCPMCGKGGA